MLLARGVQDTLSGGGYSEIYFACRPATTAEVSCSYPKSSSYGHQGDQSVPWQDPACFLIYDQGSQGQLICHTQVACLGGESDSFVQQSCVLAAHAATGTA